MSFKERGDCKLQFKVVHFHFVYWRRSYHENVHNLISSARDRPCVEGERSNEVCDECHELHF